MRLTILVDKDWRPVEGDGYDAVLAALDFAEVPARIIEHADDPFTTLRRTQTGRRAAVAARDLGEEDADALVCDGCGGELLPDYCGVCDSCGACCSCGVPVED
jgi:hypothetical protein